MTIGLDISALGERNSGTSRYIHCLASQLQATGHETIAFPSQPLKQLPRNHRLRAIPVLKRGGVYRHWYRTFELSDEMMKANVDCGIFPNYLMPLHFPKPSLIIIHDLSFFSHPQFYSKAFVLYYKDQLKRILKLNPLIATGSEYSKESIHRHLGVSPGRILLLQAYVDPHTFPSEQDAFGDGGGRPYFLYVGHIEPRKNLPFLIKNFIAWKTANGIQMDLKIVGDLWLNSSEIRDLLRRYSQRPDIEFTGYVEEERLHRLYAHASAFVHSSIVEGFGFPVLEALHYGLPVLCSAGTSTEEISTPYSVAVRPDDDSDLLAGFDRLLLKSSDPASRPCLQYSPERMRDQLETVLGMLMDKKIIHLHALPQYAVETAVQRTLLYYRLFNSGIPADALHTFLLDVKVTRQQLENAVASLIERNIINRTNDMLRLNADVGSFYVRKKKSIDGNVTRRLLSILNNLPFITAIAFSGGTAQYGLDDHDDIDLFIITKPFTVYIVYALIHAIALLMRSRKIICMNYLVDENGAEIHIHRDLYTAHQIVALKAFKNGEYLRHFLNKNSWIIDHYPNCPIPDSSYPQSSAVYHLFRPVNRMLMKLYQRRYHEVIRTAEEGAVVLSDTVMKLHTRDYRGKVIAEFERQWSEYLRRKDAAALFPSIAQ